MVFKFLLHSFLKLCLDFQLIIVFCSMFGSSIFHRDLCLNSSIEGPKHNW